MNGERHTVVLGIGMELCDVDQMRRDIAAGATRLESLFTPAEIAYCQSRPDPAPHLAARWAAKQACLKAMADLASPSPSLIEVEVTRTADGAPQLRLSGALEAAAIARGTVKLHVSLTHTAELAAAVVMLEEDG